MAALWRLSLSSSIKSSHGLVPTRGKPGSADQCTLRSHGTNSNIANTCAAWWPYFLHVCFCTGTGSVCTRFMNKEVHLTASMHYYLWSIDDGHRIFSFLYSNKAHAALLVLLQYCVCGGFKGKLRSLITTGRDSGNWLSISLQGTKTVYSIYSYTTCLTLSWFCSVIVNLFASWVPILIILSFLLIYFYFLCEIAECILPLSTAVILWTIFDILEWLKCNLL